MHAKHATNTRFFLLCCAFAIALATLPFFASVNTAHAASPAKTSVSSITSKSCSGLTVKAKKVSKVSGYQVRVSTSSSMKNAKTVTTTSTTARVTKLSSGKTYYVQARTYKKSGKKKYYSAWSSKKTKQVTKISGSYISYPAEITLGSAFDFKAKIDSNYKIKKVVGYIKNSKGKVVQSVTVKPNKTSYKIYNGPIDNGLSCGKLSSGVYTYKLVAYVNETHKNIVNQAFKVKASGKTNVTNTSGTTMRINNEAYARIIFNYARKHGCNNMAAAAIVGNAQQESSINPSSNWWKTESEQRRVGYGLFQWTGSRYDNLVAYAKSKGKDKSDLTIQLDFLFMELKGYTLNSKKFGSEWYGANYKIDDAKCSVAQWMTWKNLDMTTEAFCECYERAGKPMMNNRKAYARYAYQRFAY